MTNSILVVMGSAEGMKIMQCFVLTFAFIILAFCIIIPIVYHYTEPDYLKTKKKK